MHVHEIKTSVGSTAAVLLFFHATVVPVKRSSLFGKSRLSSKCDKKKSLVTNLKTIRDCQY